MTQLPIIKLNTDEQAFFNLIKDFLAETNRKTVVRVAGGWVRDKLMGKPSNDIDLTIDENHGVEFSNDLANYINNVKTKPEQNTGCDSSKKKKIHGFGVIKANPEKSKHLTTTTFEYQSFSIDVNCLREEVYEDTSRIPNVKFHEVSPQSDATRRDFTINCLFYNINTEQIEDYTGGIEDLKNKILRTPLCPTKTFTDDPLRLLRGVRFSACLGFKLTDDIKKAGKCEKIRKFLFEKVSRERIGIEIKKVLELKPNKKDKMEVVVDFFSLLHELTLEIIILCPDLYRKEGEITNHIDEFQKGLNRLKKLSNISSMFKLENNLSFPVIMACYYSCLSNQCSLRSLKYSKHETKSITRAILNSETIANYIDDLNPQEQKLTLDGHSHLELLLAKTLYSIKSLCTMKETMLLVGSIIEANEKDRNMIVSELLKFCSRGYLHHIVEFKPKYNGKEIKNIMKIKKDSMIKNALSSQTEFFFTELLKGVHIEGLLNIDKESEVFKRMVSYITEALSQYT
eukprot:GAHX01001847.1.p1 GENE.GAHX01001847.1~~GAHX01001847.1.p1  ORF type:complete len:513 (-),score=91.55 GAHX01001847.1:26-1564(-)